MFGCICSTKNARKTILKVESRFFLQKRHLSFQNIKLWMKEMEQKENIISIGATTICKMAFTLTTHDLICDPYMNELRAT